MGKNTTMVKIENLTGEIISSIKYLHRYDEDVYNQGNLDLLGIGNTSQIGVATYWTGFLRTGYDYWWIQFTRDGEIYTCKANFYCYLTSDDAESKADVILQIRKDEMEVCPPKSSHCKVRIYKSYELQNMITQNHADSGKSDNLNAEDSAKKCGGTCAV